MAGPMTMGGNRSKWRPNSAAPMNNNPMGVQSVMQPVAPPMAPTMPPRPVAPNPLPSANPGYGPPAVSNGGPPTINAPRPSVPAVQTQPQGQPPAAAPRPNIRIPGPPSVPGVTVTPLPSRGMAQRFAQTPYGMSTMPGAYPPAGVVSPPSVPKLNIATVDSAVDPVAPAPAPATGSRMPLSDAAMPAMEAMVERLRPGADNIRGLQQRTMDSLNRPLERNRNEAAGIPNVIPQDRLRAFTGTDYVNGSGSLSPRIDTSMARNVMAGQPAEGSPNAGRPMNIPGATQTLNGRVVSDPQRYGQEGVIPGAMRGMTPAEGDLHGYSPDAFRVATGGQPMIPYTPSGVAATDGRTARQTTIANRNARARGVRGSDVQLWRARRNAEMQASLNPTGEPTTPAGPPAPNPGQTQPSNPNDPTAYGTNPFGSAAMWAWRQMFGGQSQEPQSGQTQPAAGQEPTAPDAGVLSPPKIPKRNMVPMQDAVGQSGRPWRNRNQYA